MDHRFLIIADDFTGSNDTGVQLKRNGIPVKVVLKAEGAGTVDMEHSVVLDTESRSLNGFEAFGKVCGMLDQVDFSKYDCVIKIVDSTLRGNIAEEIAAVDQLFRSELIIFAPAFPDLGRTTVNGVHHLNGIPITRTEIGKDPKKPITEDNLKNLMSKVFEENIVHMDLDRIRGGFNPEDARIYTFDAEKNSDLLTIISAAQKTGKRTLFAGTAAIAENIMESIEKTAPAFCVCGSVSEVTNRQVHEAEQKGVHLVQVSVPDLLRRNVRKVDYAVSCVEAILDGKDTILLSSASYDRQELDRSVAAGKERGMTRTEVSAYTRDVLGEIAEEVLKHVRVSGVLLTGGDTAMGFLEKIGADGSIILEEVAVGIPKMEVTGGMYSGLPVITKAGAFGKEDAIVYGLRKLKEKKSRK